MAIRLAISGLLLILPLIAPKSESFISERATMLAAVRQHLLRAQQRMKSQADKKRSDRSFAVGDMVYLKLQPYVQSSLAPRSNQKLSFKYFSPYKSAEKWLTSWSCHRARQYIRFFMFRC